MKSYGNNIVLDNYSYTFADTGFYLIFGESGSGKTTLLNVLSGMIPFDSGSVEINGTSLFNLVDIDSNEYSFDYITQDSFFVDYLTVYDNLRIICDDHSNIIDTLEQFGLGGKEKQYPSTLSGGERQRLSIIRSILSAKHVLFLDEPTAALDEENKLRIFELLSFISKSCLVICSSHDIEAKIYADSIIEFSKHKRENSTTEHKFNSYTKIKRANTCHRHAYELRPFLKKWFSSRKRSKHSDILFILFMTLALCFLMIADTPMRKLDANAAELYRINILEIRTNNDKKSDYEYLKSLSGVRNIVPLYGSVLPKLVDEEQLDPNDGDIELPPVEYEIDALYTLPGDATLFPFSDRIQYGSYYTSEHQIIISDAYARYLSPDSPESLIGQTVTKNLYGFGDIDFIIVGILDPIDDFEYQYFQVATGGVSSLTGRYSDVDPYTAGKHDNEFYINGDIFTRYEEDEFFNNGGNRTYLLYFEDYYSMKAFWLEHCESIEGNGYYGMPFFESDLVFPLFQLLSFVLFPLATLIVFMTIMLYSYLVRTELFYNNKFVSVFNYAGYSIGQIISILAILIIERLLLSLFIAGVMSFTITIFVNTLNRRFLYVNFEIFTYNIPLIVVSLVAICISSVISVNIFLRRLRYRSWYENLISKRDLL